MSVSLSQSEELAFPDRPTHGGRGLVADLSMGNNGAFVQQNLDVLQARLHCRIMLNMSTVTVGQMVLIRGFDDTSTPVLTMRLNATQHVIELEVFGELTLTGTLVADGPGWQCVEWSVDEMNHKVNLWINGQLVDEGNIASDVGLTQFQLGVIYKETLVTGRLGFDEWVMGNDYIGPVYVEPVSDYANDPARWLVIYNKESSQSRQWVESYRLARHIPFSNLCGLDLSTSETITQQQFTQMRDAIATYIDRNSLTQVLGILCGYDVPGYYTRSDGQKESIVDQLHNLNENTFEIDNPLYTSEQVIRPECTVLNGAYITARIDGTTLTDAVRFHDQALTVESEGMGDGMTSQFWFDPTIQGVLYQQRVEAMKNWGRSIDRQKLLLPFEMNDALMGQESSFDSIERDGFYWGWNQADVPTFFFGEVSGERLFCHQTTLTQANCSTLRDSQEDQWCNVALQAGYLSIGGFSRIISGSSVPAVERFFAALREGWTLCEAWAVACPLWQAGLMFVGDPLATIALPQSGWWIYGPIESLPLSQSDQPIAVLRDDEHQWDIPVDMIGQEGQSGQFVIRRIGSAVQSGQATPVDYGHATIELQRIGNQLVRVPPTPAMPSAYQWQPEIVGNRALIEHAWARRFGDTHIERVELIEQLHNSDEEVVQVLNVNRNERSALFERELVLISRYKTRAFHSDGGYCDSPWSKWVSPTQVTVESLQLLQEPGI